MTFNASGPGRKYRTTHALDMAAYDKLPAPIRAVYRNAMRDYACEPALKAYQTAIRKGHPMASLVRNFQSAITQHDAWALQSANMLPVWGKGHPQARDSSKSAEELGL